MSDPKPIFNGPSISPAPRPELVNPVDYSHFEIPPDSMEYLRDRYCKKTEDSNSILAPLQDIQTEGKFKAGDFEEAADYLKRNYGSEDFDFCERGTGSGGPFWGQNSNSTGLSYTIHNTWWGYLMTDALPLCQSISYTVNSNARMLPMRFEQLFNQAVSTIDPKTFPEGKMEDALSFRESCLAALRQKHHARLDNKKVGLEWTCLSALKALDVETPDAKRDEQPIWPGAVQEAKNPLSQKPSEILQTELDRRLGKLSWDEWVVLEGDVCRPYISDNEQWKKWAWTLTGGTSVLTLIALRAARMITFTKLFTEIFGIRTAGRWGMNSVKKIWRRVFPKGPDDKDPPPPPAVPVPEPKETPKDAPKGGGHELRGVPVPGDPSSATNDKPYQAPWWLPWVPALLGAEMMRRLSANPEPFMGEANGPRMPLAEAFRTLFDSVKPTFSASALKGLLDRSPREGLAREVVRTRLPGTLRERRAFEQALRAVTRRGVR